VGCTHDSAASRPPIGLDAISLDDFVRTMLSVVWKTHGNICRASPLQNEGSSENKCPNSEIAFSGKTQIGATRQVSCNQSTRENPSEFVVGGRRLSPVSSLSDVLVEEVSQTWQNATWKMGNEELSGATFPAPSHRLKPVSRVGGPCKSEVCQAGYSRSPSALEPNQAALIRIGTSEIELL